MKTIRQIKDEILEIKSNYSELDAKEQKKSKDRISVLNDIILYLEHNPTIDFLNKEKGRLESLILSFNDKKRYRRYLDDNLLPDNSKSKAKYKSELNISIYKKHLNTINYILAN